MADALLSDASRSRPHSHRPHSHRPHSHRSHGRGRTRRVAVLGLPGSALAGLLAGMLAGPAAPAVAAPAAGSPQRADVLAAAGPPAGYVRRDIAWQPDSTWTEVGSINLHGRVVGTVTDEQHVSHGFVSDARGKITRLPLLAAHPKENEGAWAGPQDDRNRIAGSATDDDGVWRAVLWTDGGPPRVVSPPDAEGAYAVAVNRSGQVLGQARKEKVDRPFVWSPQTGARYLFDPLKLSQWGTTTITATGFNDSGAVTGAMEWPKEGVVGTTTAYLWTPSGGLVDLLAAPRAQGFETDYVSTVDLSESGTVAVTAEAPYRGVVFGAAMFAVPPGGPAVRLDVERSASRLEADPRALVDARGRVVAAVGWAGDGCPSEHPAHRTVEWDAAHGIRDLPRLGLPCGEVAAAVNDAGEVLGVMQPRGELRVGGLYVWDPQRGARDLGAADGWAWQLTEAGQVLGRDLNEGPPASIWSPPEGMVRVVAPSIADTSVVPDSPTGPLGSRPWLVGGKGATALMRFAVPKPPQGRSLVAATVLLWTTGAKGAGSSVPLEVRRVTGPWSQATTWADRPSVGTRRLGVAGVVGAGEALSVRLDTSQIPVKGGSIDLALTGSGLDGVQVGSREASEAKLRPVIELVYR